MNDSSVCAQSTPPARGRRDHRARTADRVLRRVLRRDGRGTCVHVLYGQMAMSKKGGDVRLSDEECDAIIAAAHFVSVETVIRRPPEQLHRQRALIRAARDSALEEAAKMCKKQSERAANAGRIGHDVTDARVTMAEQCAAAIRAAKEGK